ncbi:hypothetical protein B7463_g10748, partial [Scytalidium lignicola]
MNTSVQTGEGPGPAVHLAVADPRHKQPDDAGVQTRGAAGDLARITDNSILIMKNSALFSVLATYASIASATFNLNTSGPDWDYVASDLANTTSQACKDAYSADINCDPTLLGLVASMRPGFKPSSSDFDNTCTSTCSDSLAAYVKGVQAACTAPGDKAQEEKGGGDYTDFYLDPVAIVGQIFQYTFAKDCSKATNGTYCYFSEVNPPANFECSDECAMQFYQAAHDFPASSKMFDYYSLVSRGSWWAGQFVTGWESAQACEKGVDNTASTASTATAAGPVSTVVSSGRPLLFNSTAAASSSPSATPTSSLPPNPTSTPSSSSTISSPYYTVLLLSSCVLGLIYLV